MRCTWQELDAMPLDKLEIAKAFIRGEEEAKKAREAK
jgi:hypothetical protein